MINNINKKNPSNAVSVDIKLLAHQYTKEFFIYLIFFLNQKFFNLVHIYYILYGCSFRLQLECLYRER